MIQNMDLGQMIYQHYSTLMIDMDNGTHQLNVRGYRAKLYKACDTISHKNVSNLGQKWRKDPENKIVLPFTSEVLTGL